jgi:pyrroline-5-carboxylate reductase
MKNEERTIGFIGAGRITKIILSVWKKHHVSFKSILVYDPQVETLKKLESDFQGVTAVTSSSVVASQADIVFLAIHPPVFADVLTEIKDTLTDQKFLVSLAPKINCQKIFQALGYTCPLARVIPNAPSAIGEGCNVFALSPQVNNEQKTILKAMFEPLGQWRQVDENKLEAYATITGMGPTYLWFLFQEICNQAVKCGMEPDEAKEATNAMIKGAAETLFVSGMDFEKVLDLIPAYPFKPQEETIKNIYAEGISGLYNKLSN